MSKYHLVWLDRNIDDRHNHRTLRKLCAIDESIEGFNDEDKCWNYIDQYEKNGGKSSILFLISASLSEINIPRFHDYRWISAIFIYCQNPKRVEHLKFVKLRGIYDDPLELMERLNYYAERDQVLMEYNFFNDQSTSEQHPMRNVQEDQARFLWFYKCHQFMIDLHHDSDEEAKEEMIKYCQEKFPNRLCEQRVIEKFQRETCQNNFTNAIRWYTESSFMFRCINEALIQSDITSIYRFRYMIRLLCRQMNQLNGNCQDLTQSSQLRLYRGLALKKPQILELSQHINDLISVNSFLSTSIDEETAIDFSRRRLQEGFTSVLLIIDVDMQHNQNIAIANIRYLSKYQEEEEVLLSIGSIFRIISVIHDKDKQLYRIYITLSDFEQLTVNNYIEQTYKDDAALNDREILFGKLLFDMGEYTLAIEYLRKCLGHLSDEDNHKRPIYLNNIGVCYNELGERKQAFIYYNHALRIYEKNPDSNETNSYHQTEFGALYHNVASYFYSTKDYPAAYRMATLALENRQNVPIGKASTYNLLGCIQLASRDEEAARESLENALRLRLRYLDRNNANHPDIAVSYENLARLYMRLTSHTKAVENYRKAAEIYRHNYPKTHPRVIAIEKRLDDLEKMISN